MLAVMARNRHVSGARLPPMRHLPGQRLCKAVRPGQLLRALRESRGSDPRIVRTRREPALFGGLVGHCRCTAVIGCLIESSSADQWKCLTKAMHGMRLQNLMVLLLQVFLKQLGVDTLWGVGKNSAERGLKGCDTISFRSIGSGAPSKRFVPTSAPCTRDATQC